MRGWKVSVEPCGKNWRCRWRGKYGNGQQVFLYKSDAEELADGEGGKRQDFQRKDAGLPPIRKKKSVLLSEWAAKFNKEREKNPRGNTYTNFNKPAIDQFMKWAIPKLGNTEVRSLTKGDVYEWKAWLYQQTYGKKKIPYGHSTVRMRLANLRIGLGWAIEMGWADENPVVGVKMPADNAPGRVLTLEDIQSAYSVVPPGRALQAMTVLLNSGMRKGEIIGMQKSQVERRADKAWRVHFQEHDTKNKTTKTVVLNEAAQAAVVTAYEGSKTQQVFEGLTEDIVDYWIRKVQEKVGKVRTHDFKHTFCTHWMRQTGDIDGLIAMTGNTLNSLRKYLKISREAPRGAAQFSGFAPIQPLNAAEVGNGQ